MLLYFSWFTVELFINISDRMLQTVYFSLYNVSEMVQTGLKAANPFKSAS